MSTFAKFMHACSTLSTRVTEKEVPVNTVSGNEQSYLLPTSVAGIVNVDRSTCSALVVYLADAQVDGLLRVARRVVALNEQHLRAADSGDGCDNLLVSCKHQRRKAMSRL